MIASLLFLALLPAVDDAEAKRLFEAGSQAYDQGRYVLAIDAFEAAHKLAPRGVTAFSAAQAHRLQYSIDLDVRQLERAVELYRAYLELAPDGNRRGHAAEHLGTLVPILDRLKREHAAGVAARPSAAVRTQVIVSSRTAGASVCVDGGKVELAPASFDVAPGRHRIEVSAPEFVTQAEETVAVAGSVVAINVALEPVPGQLEVQAPPGSRLLVDGRLVGTAPLARLVELRPGHHTVAATARGSQPFVREVELARGQKLGVTVQLRRTAQRWASYGMFAAGGALVAGTAVSWGLALDKQTQAQAYLALPSRTQDEQDRYTALRAERDQLVTAGIATGAIGVAAGALGLVLWLFDNPEAPAAVVAPVVGDHLTGLAVSGRF